MQTVASDRGFLYINYPSYPAEDCGGGEERRLVSESSAIGDYEDSWDNPGSSFLWVGDNHHLNREEVAELVAAMQHWLDNGRLPEPPSQPDDESEEDAE